MTRLPALAAAALLASTLGAGIALAQTATGTTSPSGQSAYPPTTGSSQGVVPPNAKPGPTSMSATPGSVQPDRVPTSNPQADGKVTPVK